MKNIILFCLGLIACCEAQKLNIAILYESLCPDSIDFIQNQLYPAYSEISPYVNIKFIPFGKSSSSNDGESFQCQHGPDECFGNMVQSCTLDALKDNPIAQVNYVVCFMQKFRATRDIPTCLAEVGVNLNYVQECKDTKLGTLLQLQAEVDTNEIRPRFVPTIVYNGVFNQQAQDASLKDFKGVVCTLIAQTYPDACRDGTLRL